ncbi:MAG: hypothetical protein WCD11_02075 [Solirubrobacteraceae bacterium]
MESKEVECEGCNQVKTVPIVHIEGETYFEGICSGCVENYGMQVGDKVRLLAPDENGETEVMFVQPEVDAIRVRSYKTGLTKTVSWSEFERIK